MTPTLGCPPLAPNKRSRPIAVNRSLLLYVRYHDYGDAKISAGAPRSEVFEIGAIDAVLDLMAGPCRSASRVAGSL